METSAILIKPSHLPPLPTYEGTLNRARTVIIALPLYAAAFVALFLYLGVGPIPVVVALVLLGGIAVYFVRTFRRARARLISVMAGEAPILVVAEVDGGHEIRPGNPARTGAALFVAKGDTVTVDIRRARDLRRGRRLLPFMEWYLGNGDREPLMVATYFDPDAALLRDVEKRIARLGATAQVTHVPFAETLDA